jgi:hypothetical protein
MSHPGGRRNGIVLASNPGYPIEPRIRQMMPG